MRTHLLKTQIVLLILVSVLGMSGAAAARFSPAGVQQPRCSGSGERPNARPVLAEIFPAQAIPGEEIVVNLLGGGFSQVQGVAAVFIGEFEVPLLDCAVRSDGEMQVRILIPPDMPPLAAPIVFVLIAAGDEAPVRAGFEIIGPGEAPGPVPTEGPPIVVDGPIINIWILIVIIVVITAVIVWSRTRDGNDKEKLPETTVADPDPDSGPDPPTAKPRIRLVPQSDTGIQDIQSDPLPLDLEIQLELHKDPGQPLVEIEDEAE